MLTKIKGYFREGIRTTIIFGFGVIILAILTPLYMLGRVLKFDEDRNVEGSKVYTTEINK